MKKKLIILASLFMALSTTAQNPQVRNKKGADLIPQKGEIGIGVNAVPALVYIGDLFGYQSSNDAIAGNKFMSVLGDNTLFGKYMLFDNQAIRGHLRVGMTNHVYENQVNKDFTSNPDEKVLDTYERKSAFYTIGAGYEWRRGTTRLRGFYGGELFYQHISGVQRNYSYGNAITPDNIVPTSTTWNETSVLGVGNLDERTLVFNEGKYNGFGLRAFAGIEYYFAPKICVGTEFGWGGSYGTTGELSIVNEYSIFESGAYKRVERETTFGGGRGFMIDTDNFNGALYLMFYF